MIGVPNILPSFWISLSVNIIIEVMSVKRQATTELNHDNWDQDDPADHEEMGTYKTAPKDVLEKRVIRTAKRRSQLATGDEVRILNTISSISTTQVKV